jgi:putative transcriptional regulator
VPSLWFRPIIFCLAVLLLPAPLLDAALPKHKLDPADASLAGQLLIASPKMPDPRFRGTVILMVRHSSKDGAVGIAVNRPVGEQLLARILEGMGETADGAEGSVHVFAGGPVEPEAGFVVHSDDYRRPETMPVNEGLAVTSSREIFRDMAHKKGPEKSLVAFGYAGWAPRQLEGELAREDWFLAPADPQLVFDEAREKVWDRAMARRPPRDL